eukprot:6779195-Prymnesium_polylepis.1
MAPTLSPRHAHRQRYVVRSIDIGTRVLTFVRLLSSVSAFGVCSFALGAQHVHSRPARAFPFRFHTTLQKLTT